MSDFQAALDHVLRWEGGMVDDPDDAGGATNYGISEAAHPEAWEDGPPTESQAISIYRNQYWSHERVQAGEIESDGIALYLFDCAVNHGPETAAQMLQEAIRRSGGECSKDGWIGPNTREALRSCDPAVVLDRYALIRVDFYREIVRADASQTTFLLGWLNRALDLLNL